MNTRNKLLSLLTASVLSVAMTSCGDTSDGSSSTGDSTFSRRRMIDSSVSFDAEPIWKSLPVNSWMIYSNDLYVNVERSGSISIVFGGATNKHVTVLNTSTGEIQNVECGSATATVVLSSAGIYRISPRFGPPPCDPAGGASMSYPTVAPTATNQATFSEPDTDNTTQVTIEMDGALEWDSTKK
jgi:hypothetical protein